MLVDDAELRLALGRDLGRALDPAAERVAGPYRLKPAQLVEAGRAERGAPVDVVVDEQPHHLGRDMPARSDQAAKHRGLGGLGVNMEGLRIEPAGEVDDLLGGEARRAQRILLTDFVVFPIARFAHRRPRCGLAFTLTRPARTAWRSPPA